MAIKVRLELEDLVLEAEVGADGKWHGKIKYVEFTAKDKWGVGSYENKSADLPPMTSVDIGAILALGAGLGEELYEADETSPLVRDLYEIAETLMADLPIAARPIP